MTLTSSGSDFKPETLVAVKGTFPSSAVLARFEVVSRETRTKHHEDEPVTRSPSWRFAFRGEAF